MKAGLLPRRLPLALVRLGRTWPRTVLAVAVLTWVVAGLVATRLHVDTDLLSLVPEHNQVVRDFKTTIDRFGSVDTLLVVIRLEPETDLEPVVAFADHLANSLRSWDLVDWVEYRMEDPLETVAPLLDRALLLLSPEHVAAVVAELESTNLDDRAALVKARLLAPQSLVTKDLVRLDPMGLLPAILARVKIGGAGIGRDPDTGCMVDADRRLLLMLVKPVRPAQDVDFDRLLVAGLGDRLAEARATWHEEGFEGSPPPVEFTGGYVITLDDTELITRDGVVNIASSLVGVLILFLFAFRRRAALVYALVPMITGLALALIFNSLAIGRLNSLTAAFGGMLVGLGIDFVIVLYGRYVGERLGGADHVQAVDAMGGSTGVGVMLGAATTAATFYAFLVTDFRGLSELGLMTGTGILLLVVAVFVCLPALLTLIQDRPGGCGRHYLHSFGSERLIQVSQLWPKTTIALTAVVTVGLGLACSRLVFDDDIRNLRSPDNQGIILQQEVMDAFGLRFTPMTVRVDGVDEASSVRLTRTILPRLEAMVASGTLASVDTIAGVVPDEADQGRVIALLNEHEATLAGFADRFRVSLAAAGLKPEAFAEGLDHLGRALAVRQPMGLTDLRGTTLEVVVNRYVAPFEGGVSTAVYCYPPAGQWRRGAPPELAALADEVDGVVLAGPNVVSAELRRIVWGDVGRASSLGLLLVVVLMWVDLHSGRRALLALAPLLVGLVWMLGTMALFGIHLNLMNIFVMTMIIGIGVDYAIHLLHRWWESGGDEPAMVETAKAITVAALTTMVGFGSLITSHYPGLRSVGAAAILGTGSIALLSITALPVLLRWREGARRRDGHRAQG